MEKWTKERLKNLGQKKFGDRFDYSQANVTTKEEKVEIICNVCGTHFFQSPNAHVHSLQGGCPTCRYKYVAEHEKLSFEVFVERAKMIHGDKYIYDKDLYVDTRTNVGIVCKKHGLFFQMPHNHLKGYDCPICGNIKIANTLTLTREEFLKRSKLVHGDRYDYSLVEYKSSYKKVKIICPKHGIFEQTPHNHWKGRGCPKCKKSLGEIRIANFLQQHEIEFFQQHKIPNYSLFCKNQFLFIDFYIPNKNAFIEYNGKQHYKEVKFWGGKEGFEHQKERDNAIRQYCKKHKIKLIEIPYFQYDNIETILSKSFGINKVKKKA